LFRWLQARWTLPWYRFPTSLLKLVYLALYREELRADNLYDPASCAAAKTVPKQPNVHWRYLYARSPDGSCNDLTEKSMGRVGTRFGRNFPLQHAAATDDPATGPSPAVVSKRLLDRGGEFKPAESINMLAAAWLQFMVHDWMDHGRDWDRARDIQVDAGDAGRMAVRQTRPDPTRESEHELPCPTFVNRSTHWWDGSQLYGSDEDAVQRLRSGEGGKLRMDGDMLPLARPTKEDLMEKGDERPLTDDTGTRGNWWLGLGLMHTLFAREHNAICDELHRQYPDWDDDDLYDHARLINTALMAKIHTVEWTPALLDHPAIIKGMHGNWWGMATEYLHRLTNRPRPDLWLALRELLPGIASSEFIGGVRGSPTDHHGVPYSITEEFVAIYRMHPLIPDELRLHSIAGEQPAARTDLDPGIMNYTFKYTGQILSETGLAMADLYYSFGVEHPGALTLRNFPAALQTLDLARFPKLRAQLSVSLGEPEVVDVATVDIVRDRERGVPRYNEFRTRLHLPRVASFEDLLPGDEHRELREEMEAVYEHIDKVDLMVGLLAERPPPGFAFSDTAFVIFVLMASRRLKSDRFFASDYRPEVYTQTGLDWIDHNTMSTVLLRHQSALAPYLEKVENPFKPWKSQASASKNDPVDYRASVRFRVPFLLDVVYVRDHDFAARLDEHPAVDRVPPGAGALFNRIIQRRAARHLTNRGEILPAFAGREDEARRELQARMCEKMDATNPGMATTEIARLAEYVRGSPLMDETCAGVTAQQLVARLLGHDDYTGTRRGYDDAVLLYGWHRGLWWRRKRTRARERLWAAAGNDPYLIHGTTFAVHNIVDTLNEMRRLFPLCAGGEMPGGAHVMARCLEAPRAVLRFCQEEVVLDEIDRPLRRGTMIVLLLRRMHGGTGLTDRAFSRDAWSQCPAHNLVPAVLAEIWDRAIAE